MKTTLKICAVAVALAPVAMPSVAQTSRQDAATRQQVRQEVVDLAAVGYYPIDWVHYPESVLAAKQRLDAQRAAQGQQAQPRNP
ncbi:DUF4148 domain-containing protein [Paraburkholderia sp. MMS20-SJTR3]|uniref:DUF4148 domain-containing protein n=1 Tax=Paraburkholderia sejongensis TaxID=2886946 RepID=A0ABS8K0Y3_9BURK|nr:DUF4148 domain-containing protein [Paraburkholderia sp. MMS20-SJTR3]MCC8395826.1 DUF4148 domain-containing protein [Paraburkholderia sp. MMS20-SJTR3]